MKNITKNANIYNIAKLRQKLEIKILTSAFLYKINNKYFFIANNKYVIKIKEVILWKENKKLIAMLKVVSLMIEENANAI